MTDDQDEDRQWQEQLEREERRRKQRTVLFGTTVEEEVAAEASAAGDPSAEKVKLTVNNIPREFHGELQALAVKHGLTLSQLGFTGLMLAVVKDQEGTLAADLADVEWGSLEDENPSQAGLEFSETVTVSIGLSRDMHHQLQQAAYRGGLSMRRVLQIGVELVIQRAEDGTLSKLPTWPAEPDQG